MLLVGKCSYNLQFVSNVNKKERSDQLLGQKSSLKIMKQNFGKLSIFILSGIILIFAPLSVQALNDNLYVSRDTMLQNLGEKYGSTIETLSKSGGCNSSFPSDWNHQSNPIYIDRISPSLSMGFYKKEFPIVIESTTFSKSQFSDSSHTAILEVGKPIKLKILIFEDTGPHNIETVTIATNFQDDSLTGKTNTAKMIFEKLDPPPPSDSIYLYIFGGIEEDQERSNTYSNKLGNYFVKISDPVGLFSNVKGTATKINHKMEIIFEITFTKPMEKSDLVITASDVDNNTMICEIIDAWQVVNSAENKESNLEENNQKFVCKEGLELLFKTSTKEPICLTPATAEFVVKTGWAYR